MADSNWKRLERRVSRFFATERSGPGQGSCGKTLSDTFHERLFIECKYASGPGGTNGWAWLLCRKKDPDRAYRFRIDGLELLLVHSSRLRRWRSARCADGRMPLPESIARVWTKTWQRARDEGMLPLLVFGLKRARGFWMLAEARVLDAAREEMA